MILGSLPGEASLAIGEYYGNPRNAFWRLMEGVIAAPLVELAYAERLGALRAAGIALWYVVGSARRTGSLDAAIRDPLINPLADFVASLPALRAVAFNGGAAATMGQRALRRAPLSVARISLPSSSPAHTLAFAEKARAWARLRDFLTPE